METPNGNLLWDLVAYLDDDTVQKVRAEIELEVIRADLFLLFDDGLELLLEENS